MITKRKTKAVFFDVAGTLIVEKSWAFLASGLGLSDEYFGLVAKLKKDRLTQEKMNTELSKMFSHTAMASRDNLKKILAGFSLKSGASELIDYLRQRQIAVYLVSGANEILVGQVAEKLGVDGWVAATKFDFDENGHLVKIIRTNSQGEWKVNQVIKMMKKNGWKREEVYFVGDGWNDIYVFQYLKKGITFDFGNWRLKKNALRVIHDLSEIAKIV